MCPSILQSQLSMEILENGNVKLTISMSFRNCAGRKRIVTPDEEVTFTDPMVSGLARAIGKDMAYVSRITRFTLLAPEIIHGILSGQLDQVGVEKCKQPFPILWDEQKKFFGIE